MLDVNVNVDVDAVCSRRQLPLYACVVCWKLKRIFLCKLCLTYDLTHSGRVIHSVGCTLWGAC